ncbi:TOTE conflict system archaeo-eukaryotic primase domain-containing protein [Pusillimonas sp.]|uniref:TOTE conflict system archaeo-eukaryotic primase domain-containing protein n=1 Tax=Pusillimonas sp. TaxID=3040095 RepID=UPI0029BECDD6|nr:hypothetical protein [Pusillimonas sp.]MDX3896143.1 hypothetical protein [Pusillimonas sp.]
MTDHRDELARLVGLLEVHGIAWQAPVPILKSSATLSLTTNEKVTLFGRLFRGRTDVYPVRWESKAGKSGYSPACANEWRPGVCEKRRIKCSDCQQRQLLPLTDQVLFDHLAGRHTSGLYPLLSGDDCHLLAVDFDESDWRDDARKPARAMAASGREPATVGGCDAGLAHVDPGQSHLHREGRISAGIGQPAHPSGRFRQSRVPSVPGAAPAGLEQTSADWLRREFPPPYCPATWRLECGVGQCHLILRMSKWNLCHFPMQKLEKISPSKSSLVN